MTHPKNPPAPKVRFAPSPTGSLHIGGARTALFCKLFAQNTEGKFVLRIEDTDLERSSDKFLDSQIRDLKWLELNWDEGPFKQSERLDIYKEHAHFLISQKKAFYCFCASDIKPTCDTTCLRLSQAQIEEKTNKTSFTIRFNNMIKKTYTLDDLIRKKVNLPWDMVGNFVLIRSNGLPVYNFSCVIDDHLMDITHVLRSEEHLSNTLRQLMLYEAFSWEIPKFAHLSMILDKDKKKLSKRSGACAIAEYREQGFLPEAILNYLALLGWSHPEEKDIFRLEEIISNFYLEKLNPSPAVFDENKLRWINSKYLKNMNKEKLASLLKSSLELSLEDIKKPLDVFLNYSETLNDLKNMYDLLDDKKFEIKNEAKETLVWKKSTEVIQNWKNQIENIDTINEEAIQLIQNNIKEKLSVKGKELFMPIRVAVLGKPSGVEIKKFVPLLTKESLLYRANFCINSIV